MPVNDTHPYAPYQWGWVVIVPFRVSKWLISVLKDDSNKMVSTLLSCATTPISHHHPTHRPLENHGASRVAPRSPVRTVWCLSGKITLLVPPSRGWGTGMLPSGECYLLVIIFMFKIDHHTNTHTHTEMDGRTVKITKQNKTRRKNWQPYSPKGDATTLKSEVRCLLYFYISFSSEFRGSQGKNRNTLVIWFSSMKERRYIFTFIFHWFSLSSKIWHDFGWVFYVYFVFPKNKTG